MLNKKNEDIEMRGGDDFGGEKDFFFGWVLFVIFCVCQEFGLFDKLDYSFGVFIFVYCLVFISMIVVNKYVVFGLEWNLNFFYFVIQVCNFFLWW